MKVDNFISFFIVVGFFMGLIIAILKFNTAEMTVIFCAFVTVMVYIIAVVVSSEFIKSMNFKRTSINKDRHERAVDFFMRESEKRELITDRVRQFVKSIEREEK